MRKLTVKRTKSFVGCLMKLKVYIEDPASSEIMINDTPCRKLGELKSGEEQSFEISEAPAKVFVIADKLSKDYCNDFYQLSEGSEDIYLSGKNKYNPANGNAFRFDNNDNNIEVLQNRKKGSRKGILVLIAAILVGFVIGFAITSGLFSNIFKKAAKPQTFTADNLRITLNETYALSEEDYSDYEGVFENDSSMVLILKDDFETLEELKSYTPEQYGKVLIDLYQLKTSEIKTDENGNTYFEYEYTDSETDGTLVYQDYIFKSSDGFWLVQFVCDKQDHEVYAPRFTEWANTVTFE